MKTRVSIQISDPWDIGEALCWRPLTGSVIRVIENSGGGHALIVLDAPLEFEGITYGYVIASPRHERAFIRQVFLGESVSCGIVGISEEQARSEEPFEKAKWRGGLALIGSLDVRGTTEESA